ncbi:MAG TPA: hypothetical protein VMZ91_00685 [Candidatus Paceibacterota bacterium]|nr:hypothetical protein [Candidatus Paceibacterota bacterium]
MTTEKPLIEKATTNGEAFWREDVAHDIGRLKAVFKDKVLYEGGSIKKIIDDIIGDLK